MNDVYGWLGRTTTRLYAFYNGFFVSFVILEHIFEIERSLYEDAFPDVEVNAI